MTPAPDWRDAFVKWLVETDRTENERAAAERLLAEIGAPEPAPSLEDRRAEAQRWAYLRRWPIEMRLGVLRILNDLGVIDALRAKQPDVHEALVAELRGET